MHGNYLECQTEQDLELMVIRYDTSQQPFIKIRYYYYYVILKNRSSVMSFDRMNFNNSRCKSQLY